MLLAMTVFPLSPIGSVSVLVPLSYVIALAPLMLRQVTPQSHLPLRPFGKVYLGLVLMTPLPLVGPVSMPPPYSPTSRDCLASVHVSWSSP